MLEESTPQQPAMSKSLIGRLKGLSSKHIFSAILAVLAIACVFADLPYGVFLLICSVLPLVTPKLGALVILISAVGIYATSNEFHRSIGITKGDRLNCAVKEWEAIEECRIKAEQDLSVEGQDQAGNLHLFYILTPPFPGYPRAGVVLASEYLADVNGQLLPDGSVEVISVNSKAADLRPLFDEVAREFVSGIYWHKTDGENVSFPATFTMTMQFKLDGYERENYSIRALLEGLLFYLLVFFSAGLVIGRYDSAASYIASIAAPTGIYISSFYACFAIASYATTNYAILGKGLFIGSVFLGLGAIAAATSAQFNARHHCRTNPIGYVMLALLPVIGISANEAPRLEFWLHEPHGFIEVFWVVFTSLFNPYVVVILFFVGAIDAMFGTRLSPRKKLDLLIMASTALVAASLVVWFLQMGAITADYVAIFPVLEIAAIGVACTSLLFIVTIVEANKPIPKLALRRRVLLLLEVFTFYLFFAYAPASVSQLGQQFVQASAAQEEKNELEERLKTIEELLEIEQVESDESDEEQ